MNAPEDQGSWQRLHPLTPLFRSLQFVYALILGGLAATVSAGPEILIGLIVIALVGGALSVVAYLRYRYQLTDDSLIITHGVLVRRRRVIPRSRIQNVDLRAGLLQQIMGTTTARIETAGGQGTEATLHVVSKSEGIRLRELLIELGAPRITPPDAAADRTAVAEAETWTPAAVSDAAEYNVSITQLAIAGATSNRAGVLVGALLGGDYFLDFMPTDWLLRRFLPPELVEPGTAVSSLVETAQQDVQAFLTGVLVLGLLFGLVGWGISVLATVVRYFDFTLMQTAGELRVAYGLFTRREKGFRRSRVQNVQIEEPILRRWWGLASIRVQTAGYGPEIKSGERMETMMPIARRHEVSGYLATVYPDIEWEQVEWRRSHPRARRRFFLRRAALVLIATLILGIAFGRPALLLLLALLPAWLLAAAHYRHLGHARSGPYVLMREGFWTRRTFIVPVRKIQALHLRQSPFQRRLGLGTLAIETAGNPVELHAPRCLDLGWTYGLEMMEGLATEVAASGLTF